VIERATALLNKLADTRPSAPGGIGVQWDRFDLDLSDGLAVTFDRLRLGGGPLARAQLAFDVRLSFKGEAFDKAGSYFRRSGGEDLPLENVHIGERSLTIQWRDRALGAWLGPFLPNTGALGDGLETTLTLRLLFGAAGDPLLREARLDWAPPGGEPARLRLPGLRAEAPTGTRLSLLLLDPLGDAPRVSLCATTAGATPLTLSSTFAWGRDYERELQPEEREVEPLFRLSLVPKDRLTLVLLELPLGGGGLPSLLRQLPDHLSELDITKPEELDTPTLYAPIGPRASDWTASFTVDLSAAYDLPFLKQGGPAGQLISLVLPTKDQGEAVAGGEDKALVNLPVDLNKGTVSFPIGVQLRIAAPGLGDGLDITFFARLSFGLARFALEVDHEGGIPLFFAKERIEGKRFLGLGWRLSGRKDDEGYHYFTLATRNGNYQVHMAEGALIELEYDRASKDPIGFGVRDFALGPAGLNLTAEVLDRPVRLNGLETRFRFTNSHFEVRENRIADFTIAGSGPLPPDLVGDSSADIAIQFCQTSDGSLKLVSSTARLRGNKLLDCRGTRFQFQVDALGLQFVDDGRYHLFFTLTGSAQFKLATSDDVDGPLALLPNIKIDMIECPLTGDASVIGRHVKFLIELPKPKSFNFLGCFELELRAFGFSPQAPEFGGVGAVRLTGQLKFAQGPGDVLDPRHDYHALVIGLPEPGSFKPRIHFKHLAVNIGFGSAFKLAGVVNFRDDPLETGLIGGGSLEIQGMPSFVGIFGFTRIRVDEQSPWLRAWFIYVEGRKLSLPIPIVQLYIREVGLGFGYRYTLTSIKVADRTDDVKELLRQLQVLARTQADLAKIESWTADPEGGDPRWTIVLRAMISQTSAAPTPLTYNQLAEQDLSCTFLFDVVIAFRSTLTFFMVGRAWLNTNYADYYNDVNGTRGNPLFTGFILLDPRRKRFLANVEKPGGARPGDHPPLPAIVNEAIANSRFSATLLIEPGLFHYELGWPNQLRWQTSIGPLALEFQGGFIFRVSSTELVIGQSFLARGKLDIDASLDLGIVGARVTARARIAYGARYIGVVAFEKPRENSALYGAIGLEVQIAFSIELWLKIELVFTSIKLSFRFSMSIGFTASLEAGIKGLNPPGLRGTGTVSFSAMGHSLNVGVRIGVNEPAVTAAKALTDRFLNVGLEATEVEPVPGTTASGAPANLLGAAVPLAAARPRLLANDVDAPGFSVPGYSIFVIRQAPAWDPGHVYFVLLPRGERYVTIDGAEQCVPEKGFLPPPPLDEAGKVRTVAADFTLHVPGVGAGLTLGQYDPLTGRWEPRTEPTFGWRANWDATVVTINEQRDATGGRPGAPINQKDGLSLATYLAYTFKLKPETRVPTPIGDPNPLPGVERISDPRVQSPSDNSYEAAVRGAVEQFAGSPFFRNDPNQRYDQLLGAAFHTDTTIYARSGQVEERGDKKLSAAQNNQQAHELRSIVVHDLIADLREYLAERDEAARARLAAGSIAFQLGLVFHLDSADDQRPDWLDELMPDAKGPTISQRSQVDALNPTEPPRPVKVFNLLDADFKATPPQFQQVCQYADASAIAIAWELTWSKPPAAGCTPAQADPEHHLVHYAVRRVALDSREPELSYTFKPGHALHRDLEEPDKLCQLRSRFQLVDYFDDTAADLAALPATGRSYLYTITPVDFAGGAGRPLTVIATRRSNQPPRVPADGELTVRYGLTRDDLAPATAATTPDVIQPRQVVLTWSEVAPDEGASVTVASYHLIFRREGTVPIGSYGLDSATQRRPAGLLPTSNARPLPTDIVLTVRPVGGQGRAAVVPLGELRAAAVLPAGRWRPQAWRVFIQTIGANGVPSALAPVRLRLVVEAALGPLGPAPVDRVEPLAVVREERRPAELEWLPRPVRLPPLPPEDGMATPGNVHFPMPLKQPPPAPLPGVDLDPNAKPAQPTGYRLDLTPALPPAVAKLAGFSLHPAGIRAIRFRWNQGPSGQPAYPLALGAGYELYELDADKATTATFSNPTALAAALRRIQDVQMLPGDDLPLTPSDTLSASQWEAWYPSAMRRLPVQRTPGEDVTRRPWYSWRESLLEWPNPYETLTLPVPAFESTLGRTEHAPALIDALGQRVAALHPLLALVLRVLGDKATQRALGIPELDAASYRLAVQASPPYQQQTLAELMASTPPPTDPYGWSVLQRLGLSVAFVLFGPDGEPLSGDRPLAAVWHVLKALQESVLTPGLRRHIHVELLFQPGRAARLREDAADGEALLALMQLSLRPATRQHLRYTAFPLTAPAGTELQLVFPLKQGQRATLIDIGDPDAGGEEIQPEEDGETTRSLRMPLTGTTTLLLRGDGPPEIWTAATYKEGTTVDETILGPLLAPRGTDGKTPPLVSHDAAQRRLLARGHLDDEQAARLQHALGVTGPASPNAGVAAALTAVGKRKALKATHSWAAFFRQVPNLGEAFAKPATASPPLAATQWLALKAHLEGLNSNDPATPPAAKIVLPLDAERIRAILPDVLTWTQRFFDAGGDMGPEADELPEPDEAPETDELPETEQRLFMTAAGPWVATAYPRAATPSFVAPDDDGRLTYVHLIEDKWAHAYRYYVQPYARYDALWRGLLADGELFGPPPATAPPAVREEDGGIDAVLDRTHPVARPLILSSRRLDEPAVPGRPVVPGRIWEVILAQHPEQLLVERNQTLARQLAFRHLAVTLLRRFVYAAWVPELARLAGRSALALQPVADIYPGIPDRYPDAPDHIDLDARPVPEEAVRSLALPERVGDFQQGGLAIQYEALPFFYEHRLLAIAQTTAKVSPITAVTQRDLHYRSPDPEATLTAVDDQAGAPERRLAVPLRRLWDSLSPEAQARWPAEAPDKPGNGAAAPKPGALPDPEVVYQIVERFSGNVEVQAELFYDSTTDPPRFAVRQLGRHFLVELLTLRVPEDPHGAYELEVALRQMSELLFSREYDPANLPELVRSRVKVSERTLRFAGVMSKDDHEALGRLVAGSQEDVRTVDTLFASWYSTVPLSGPIAQPPASLAGKLEPLAPNECVLVWDGPFDPVVHGPALTALPGDEAFRRGVGRLATLAAGPTRPAEVVIAPDVDQTPPELAGKVRAETAGGGVTALTWSGDLAEADVLALRRWAQFPAFSQAVEQLIAAVRGFAIEQPLPAEVRRPDQAELTTLFADELTISHTAVTWSGPRPDDVGLSTLRALASRGDEPFQTAVKTIIAQLEPVTGADPMTITQPLTPEELRPDGPPPLLAERLTIGPLLVGWQGYPATLDELVALGNLAGQGDASFQMAIAAIVVALGKPVRSTLGQLIPLRPRQADLPEAVAKGLLIGRSQVRYHGLMTPAESAALLGAVASAPDRDAVRRLYAASLHSGLDGRTLHIRARRASAPPSAAAPLTNKPPSTPASTNGEDV